MKKLPILIGTLLYKHRDKINRKNMDEAIRIGRAALAKIGDSVNEAVATTRANMPEVWAATPDRPVDVGDRIQRANHPNHRGEIASIKDGFALVWWDDELVQEVMPPHIIPVKDLEHERRRIF